MASGSGCLAGECLVGVVVRRYIDFLILYPYSSCIWVFFSSIPTFCSFKKMFFRSFSSIGVGSC